LSKSFGGVQALIDLSCEFPKSGILAIIGPNGAGKTTLLNVLSGLVRPDVGRALLDKYELTNMRPYQIARLGIARTFQNLRLISQISVLQNVLLCRPNQKGERFLRALFRTGVADEERQNWWQAMHWLKLVGLDSAFKEFAGALSYGQQKLLALACCLATEAQILLLDEPLAGVHPDMVEKILGLMQELRKMEKLVIFIEHDIASVRQIADFVIMMDHGNIMIQGEPGVVLERSEIMDAYVS
jgi:ABC-type branched-subunit amino acid transport system ATPase component